MKKLVKWSLIIGVVICLLGVGMITTGAMMGGGDGVVSYLRSSHAVLWYDGWYDDWYDGWYDGWHEEGRYSGNQRIDAGASGNQLDEVTTYENISKLEIESAIGTIELVEEAREDPNDQAVRVARYQSQNTSRSYYEIRQDREELKIQFRGPTRDLRREDVESLTIYVPEGYRFRQLDVETNAGSFYAEVLYADEVELSLRAGEIMIDRGEITNLDVECAAGKLECQALVSRFADVECQAGSVDIWLAEAKDQYNYELECKTGTITLAGEEEERYTGLWQKKYIDHRAANKVELECAAGEITVNFPDTV